MKPEQKFQIFCPSIVKSNTNNPNNLDEPLILEGIVSTTSVDLEGDYMTSNCIASMKKQLERLNIHADHLRGLDGVIGSIIIVFLVASMKAFLSSLFIWSNSSSQ